MMTACTSNESAEQKPSPDTATRQNTIDTNKKPDPVPAAKIYANDRFKDVTVQPAPEGKFLVQGKAQVFEASFGWVVEDGHSELAMGHQMTDAGAPEWGNFSFHIMAAPKPNATLHLILFEVSAKDGSRQHELAIPLH